MILTIKKRSSLGNAFQCFDGRDIVTVFFKFCLTLDEFCNVNIGSMRDKDFQSRRFKNFCAGSGNRLYIYGFRHLGMRTSSLDTLELQCSQGSSELGRLLKVALIYMYSILISIVGLL